MKKIVIAAFIGIAIFSGGNLFGQDFSRKGKAGLSATLQSNQYGIMIPVFVAENFAFAPALDFKFAQEQGSEVSVGLVPRYYFKQGNFSPYLGLRFGAIMYFPPNDGESTLDLIIGPAFGGEYFFNEHFSIGVEAQANITVSDEDSNRFGNRGNINVNMATMISGSIYF